jgi:hypothetical protein
MDLYLAFTNITEQVNIYDVYGICYNSTNSSEDNSDIGYSKVGNQLKSYKKSFTASDYTPWAKL